MGCLTVKILGLKGGVCLLWKPEVDPRVISYSQNHIDFEIVWAGKNWRFTDLYGFPEGNRKNQTWDLIHFLHNHNDNPWLGGGDLNETLCESQKSGGVRAIESFKEAIDDCNLSDIKGSGSVLLQILYFYTNKQTCV